MTLDHIHELNRLERQNNMLDTIGIAVVVIACIAVCVAIALSEDDLVVPIAVVTVILGVVWAVIAVRIGALVDAVMRNY